MGFQIKLTNSMFLRQTRTWILWLLVRPNSPKANKYTCLAGAFTERIETIGSEGGIILAIRQNLASKRLDINQNNDTKTEIVAAEVRLANGIRLVVASLYAPPSNHSLDKNLLEAILNVAGNVIITGDFNAKHRDWMCARANTNGTCLQGLCLSKGLRLGHPDTPTYIPRRAQYHPSTIDLSLVKGLHAANERLFCLDLYAEAEQSHLSRPS